MEKNQTKQSDELRLRTLQRLMSEFVPEEKRNDKRSLILNPANLLVMIVALPATAAILLSFILLDQLVLGLVGLAVQTSAIACFFAFPRYENMAGRIVLSFHVVMYSYLMIVDPGARLLLGFVMFIHPAFSYVVVGYVEALFWSSLLTVMVAASGAYHLSSNRSEFDLEPIQLIVMVCAMFTVTIFIHALDMVAKFSKSKIQNQTASLSKNNAKYDFILSSIGDGFVATDDKGVIEFVSKSTLSMVGMTSDELIGKPFINNLVLLSKDNLPVAAAKHPITKALGFDSEVNNDRASEERYLMLKKDRSSFPVSFTISPIIINDRTTGSVMVFRDISAEDQVDKAKSEFVSIASHQLRTPLNVISWYVEKLLSGKGGDLNERGQRYLKELEISNQRMIELVGAILNASRIELGKLKMQYSDIDVVDLTNRLVSEVKPLAEEKNIRVTTRFAYDSYILHNSDKEHATVVIQNLLSNASKYTSKDGIIDVSIEPVESGTILNAHFAIRANKEGIKLTVADNGMGIPREQQDKIFGKMFRASNAVDSAVVGTGLGLFVTKSLTEELGGQIWFESHPGEGTKFSIFLPTTNERKDPSDNNTVSKEKLNLQEAAPKPQPHEVFHPEQPNS